MKIRVLTSIGIAIVGIPLLIFSGHIVFPIALSILALIASYEMLRVLSLHKNYFISIPAYLIALALPMGSYLATNARILKYILLMALVFFAYLLYLLLGEGCHLVGLVGRSPLLATIGYSGVIPILVETLLATLVIGEVVVVLGMRLLGPYIVARTVHICHQMNEIEQIESYLLIGHIAIVLHRLPDAGGLVCRTLIVGHIHRTALVHPVAMPLARWAIGIGVTELIHPNRVKWQRVVQIVVNLLACLVGKVALGNLRNGRVSEATPRHSSARCQQGCNGQNCYNNLSHLIWFIVKLHSKLHPIDRQPLPSDDREYTRTHSHAPV